MLKGFAVGGLRISDHELILIFFTISGSSGKTMFPVRSALFARLCRHSGDRERPHANKLRDFPDLFRFFRKGRANRKRSSPGNLRPALESPRPPFSPFPIP